MPILQEQKSVMYRDVRYADFAGAKIGYVQNVDFASLFKQKTGYLVVCINAPSQSSPGGFLR